MTIFYCFVNGIKLQRIPKNLELDINVAKMGNSALFRSIQQIPQQMANSAARHENPHAAENCRT